MSVGQINITQTFARLEWETLPPTYTFEPAHTTITIDKQPVELILNRTPPMLRIDQSQCWADMDLKNVFQRIAEAAEDGKQQVLKYIEKATLDGEQLGAIGNPGNVIYNQALGHKLIPKQSLQYGNVPENFSLRYECIPGELNIDWKPGEIKIDVQTVPFKHSYEKGKILYAMQRKNELYFEVAGGSLNATY